MKAFNITLTTFIFTILQMTCSELSASLGANHPDAAFWVNHGGAFAGIVLLSIKQFYGQPDGKLQLPPK